MLVVHQLVVSITMVNNRAFVEVDREEADEESSSEEEEDESEEDVIEEEVAPAAVAPALKQPIKIKFKDARLSKGDECKVHPHNLLAPHLGSSDGPLMVIDHQMHSCSIPAVANLYEVTLASSPAIIMLNRFAASPATVRDLWALCTWTAPTRTASCARR